MVAEPTTSQPLESYPGPLLSWVRVLVLALVSVVGAMFVGMIPGFLLFSGLVAWVAGPEALSDFPDNFYDLPAEAQILLTEDAWVLCAILFTVPLGIAALWVAVPRPGPAPREFLGLKWPGLQEGLIWALILLTVDHGYRWFLVEGLGLRFSQDDGIEQIARIPLFFPLVFVALAILLPIFVELFCRGFLLEGLRRSRLGEVAAVLITAFLWNGMESDFDARSFGLYLNGILLALARLRTGSTYLTMLVQVITNAVAILALASG